MIFPNPVSISRRNPLHQKISVKNGKKIYIWLRPIRKHRGLATNVQFLSLILLLLCSRKPTNMNSEPEQ